MFVVNALEGQQIRVADRTLTVLELSNAGVVQVQVEGEQEPLTVAWDRKVEIFPEVWVSVERQVGFKQRLKFLFDAPRHVTIRQVSHGSSP